ncbi:peptidase inhibitor family I36 protein [uncultured Kordia sp.]|uniref:peptidase inhibitor family I36 protein n=1 Tax=uncultured Kordia sp. TaxID=507699 RepID=UPI002631A825|nr:peptidase inhibitor family I36 protein [uncultured Kordia sp.]
MSTCNVSFFKDDDFDGRYKNYDGARNVSDLEDVHWHDHDGDNMKDDISSITTSTQTWIRVYSKANYQGRTALIGPNARIKMEDLMDDNGEDDMDDTIESFQLFDHEPSFNTTNVINNFIALYPGSDHDRKNNIYNSEFYAQNVKYRIYDPVITLGSSKASFRIDLEHIQLETNDKATVTFGMDFSGNYIDQVEVTYTMADATQIPDWVIKIVDGAIDVAADAAKIIADGAEIVITDGVGVVATVETNKIIDYTAKAVTFCVDHLNTVLNAVFNYQDDGGTMYFAGIVSHSIARSVLAYYEEIFGPDTNPVKTFTYQNFLSSMGVSSFDNSRENPFVEFKENDYDYRAYYPDNTFFYAQGGSLSSVKIDAVTGFQKDDHLIMQSIYDPKGNLFSIVGSIDIFGRNHDDDYTSPASGIVTYNKEQQMIHIGQDGTVTNINYNSLQDAYQDKMLSALNSTANTFDMDITDHQYGLIDASMRVLAATKAGM